MRYLDTAIATPGAVVIEALVDAYVPMMPPKMPSDYAENFEKALHETPSHEKIEENLQEEPTHSMMYAEQQ